MVAFAYESPEIGEVKIKVVGVGGGGGNALNCMVLAGVKNIDYIAVNTDAQALSRSQATEKIQIGTKLTHGLGAGGRPEVGEGSAQESKDEIAEAIKGANMIFITAGMGGGTGTGAAPVVAEIAKDMGILTVAVVTKPFNFEGAKKMQQAEKGINELLKHVDSLVVIPNEKLLSSETKLTMRQSFALADDVLKSGVKSISDLILNPGFINLDFADVSTIMKSAGYAHMAIGHGEGKDKIQEATSQVITSPLLETSIKGAKRLLINIVASDDILIDEVNDASKLIQNAAAPDVEIIFGASYIEDVSDMVSITVIAADFDGHGHGSPTPIAPVQMQEPVRQAQPTPMQNNNPTFNTSPASAGNNNNEYYDDIFKMIKNRG